MDRSVYLILQLLPMEVHWCSEPCTSWQTHHYLYKTRRKEAIWGKKARKKTTWETNVLWLKKGLSISYVKVLFVGRHFFSKSKICTVQSHEHLICILVYSSVLSFVGIFILKCYNSSPITLPWNITGFNYWVSSSILLKSKFCLVSGI